MKFSEKQKLLLNWWRNGSPFSSLDGIICDGAVRSGKTFCLGTSFFLWAMSHFNGRQFALCGKSLEAVRRNLLWCVRPTLEALGFRFQEQLSRKRLVVSCGKRSNAFYLFGGKDESSAALIQGVTLAGVLLDEVALMPRSFVEQALARCSVPHAKLWFSCNPEGPEHWFYKEWVCKADQRRCLRVPFRMSDNPSLSPETLRQYERRFQGIFYRRFVLGEWKAAEGKVYDFFDPSFVKPPPPEHLVREWRISIDYGTVNPTSMGLWGRVDNIWYRVKEFYWDSRREGRQKTDWEYADDLLVLAGSRSIGLVIVDPSAASFLTLLRQRGWRVAPAHNDVLSGIRVTAELLKSGRIVLCEGCQDALREIELYRWDEKTTGDRVVKEFDHAMDEIRYFAMSLRTNAPVAGAISVERRF